MQRKMDWRRQAPGRGGDTDGDELILSLILTGDSLGRFYTLISGDATATPLTNDHLLRTWTFNVSSSVRATTTVPTMANKVYCGQGKTTECIDLGRIRLVTSGPWLLDLVERGSGFKFCYQSLFFVICDSFLAPSSSCVCAQITQQMSAAGAIL